MNWINSFSIFLFLRVALTQQFEGVFYRAEEIAVYDEVAILALLDKFHLL
jgi:hypothetical protein